MSAIRKSEMTPDEAFLQQAFKDGRATKQDVSMRAIGTPDIGLQARVQHLDMDHCRRLERAKEATGSLAPIVLFRETQKRGKLYLADGHHRHYVYSNLKCSSIPAYVIDSDAAELEALEFATMCNREMCLGRSMADIRKAVEMLFRVDKWWRLADTTISGHVGGCSSVTIRKWRSDFAEANNTEIPEFVIAKDGKVMPSRRERNAVARIYEIPPKGNLQRSWKVKAGGQQIIQTTDKDKALKALKAEQDFIEQMTKKRVMLNSFNSVKDWLSSRMWVSFLFKAGHGSKYAGLYAIKFKGGVCLPCDFKSAASLPLVVGRLVGASQIADTGKRIVVLCYPGSGAALTIEAYKKAGIEFMTPDELIASLGPVIPEELKSESIS